MALVKQTGGLSVILKRKKSKDAKKAEPENDIKGEVFRANCFHYVE